ncbi:hypothetical protein BsWGS_28448 [Bradybaena similaris]
MQMAAPKAGSLTPRLCLLLSLLTFTLAYVAADFELTILHTNDVHARIEETDKNSGPCTADLLTQKQCFGGAARIRTMVRHKRQQFPNQTVLLDAGDQFQGTLWFYVFGGLVSAQFMNLIGYEAMAIGNHEFDSGVAGLAPFAHNLTFPLLASNINVSRAPALEGVVRKSTILQVGGQLIGVVGYTTTETPYVSSPGNVTFVDELAAVQGEIDKLVAQGLQIIIALGHSGFAIDRDLAAHLKNVDIVVGGHTNTFLYNGTAPSSEVASDLYPTVVENVHDRRPVLVVQDYAYGKYLGELHVTFNNQGDVIRWSGNPILLDGSVAKDNETEELLQRYLPEVEKMKSTVIGQAQVELKADRVLCRTTECNLGNLVADALVHQNLQHASNDSWADVGIAVVNAGSFRSSINKGPITIEEVVFVQPFRNTVSVMEILGQTLIDMLELGASKWTQNRDEAFGGFLQVSGLQITYDIRRPEGQRVVEVLAVCTRCLVPTLEPLLPLLPYKILASAFIINGGDGYHMLPGKVRAVLDIGYLDTDILLNYIKKFTPIVTGLQGRIRHFNETKQCETKGTGNTLSWTAANVGISLIILCALMYNI